jgi:hypothetical protein
VGPPLFQRQEAASRHWFRPEAEIEARRTTVGEPAETHQTTRTEFPQMEFTANATYLAVNSNEARYAVRYLRKVTGLSGSASLSGLEYIDPPRRRVIEAYIEDRVERAAARL